MKAETSGRFLYIVPPPVPPLREARLNKTAYMSEVINGDALMPVWWKTPEEAEGEVGSYPVFTIGRFRHHLFLWGAESKGLRILRTSWFYLTTGLRIHRQERIAVIMCYGTNWNGIVAVLLKWMTGAKLIAEIPGVPHHAFVMEVPRPGWGVYFKRWCANRLLSFVVRYSDRTKLLYPEQLARYPALRRIPASVFHDFVPSAPRAGEARDDRYVLTLGHPWYRKGLDVLIAAFVAAADRIPGYRLRIVGYFPKVQRRHLQRLIGGCPAISLEGPVPYQEALALMSHCSIFVLASRSEAMGRVLLEAMAAGKPIIASRATGIPWYVHDGENGLLFESGDVADLSEKIVRLVQDQSLQRRLGEGGLDLFRSDFDEAAYVRHFREMLGSLGIAVADRESGARLGADPPPALLGSIDH